jgi:hypothetical protein
MSAMTIDLPLDAELSYWIRVGRELRTRSSAEQRRILTALSSMLHDLPEVLPLIDQMIADLAALQEREQAEIEISERAADISRDIRRKLGNDPSALKLIADKVDELAAKRGGLA